MGGQRGSGGGVSGDTDLGDLRGHSQGGMSWACETPGWVMAGWPIRTPRRHWESSCCGIASDGVAARSVIHRLAGVLGLALLDGGVEEVGEV